MSMSGRSGSAPIFRASAVLSSSGRSLSNRAKEMSSAVRYQGCRLRTLVVAADTLGSYFLNLWSDLCRDSLGHCLQPQRGREKETRT